MRNGMKTKKAGLISRPALQFNPGGGLVPLEDARAKTGLERVPLQMEEPPVA